MNPLHPLWEILCLLGVRIQVLLGIYLVIGVMPVGLFLHPFLTHSKATGNLLDLRLLEAAERVVMVEVMAILEVQDRCNERLPRHLI